MQIKITTRRQLGSTTRAQTTTTAAAATSSWLAQSSQCDMMSKWYKNYEHSSSSTSCPKSWEREEQEGWKEMESRQRDGKIVSARDYNCHKDCKMWNSNCNFNLSFLVGSIPKRFAGLFRGISLKEWHVLDMQTTRKTTNKSSKCELSWLFSDKRIFIVNTATILQLYQFTAWERGVAKFWNKLAIHKSLVTIFAGLSSAYLRVQGVHTDIKLQLFNVAL